MCLRGSLRLGMIFLPPVYSLTVVTSSVEYHLGIVINMGERSGIMRSLMNNNLVPRVLSYSSLLSLRGMSSREPWERGSVNNRSLVIKYMNKSIFVL